MALHVLLHGGQAGAVLRADGALVGRRAVMRSQVLDHGRVVPGALVTQLALEGLLTCGGRGAGEARREGGGCEHPHSGLLETFSPSRSALFSMVMGAPPRVAATSHSWLPSA